MTEDPNSEQKPKQIPGRFVKGQSGNPGGRPHVALLWKERCRRFLDDEGGWDQLLALTRTPGEPATSLAALKVIVEYAHGRPNQHVDVSASGPLIKAYIGVDLDRI